VPATPHTFIKRVLDRFSKCALISRKTVRWELCSSERTDTQTQGHEEASSRFTKNSRTCQNDETFNHNRQQPDQHLNLPIPVQCIAGMICCSNNQCTRRISNQWRTEEGGGGFHPHPPPPPGPPVALGGGARAPPPHHQLFTEQ
jgi:hypothetical protein